MKTCVSHLMIFFFSLFLVPIIDGREKPIISYEGDIAVMVCTTVYNPKAWAWYMTNGTELVRSPSVGQASMTKKKVCILCTSLQALQIPFPLTLAETFIKMEKISVVFTIFIVIGM